MSSEDDQITNVANQNPYLVKGDWIIPGGRAEDRVLERHGLRIKNGVIDRVAPWNTLQSDHSNEPVIGSEDHAVLPGFINAHHHSHGAPLSSMGIEEDVLEPWLLSMYTSPSADPFLKTRWAAIRQARTGVTSTMDMARVDGPYSTANETIERVCQAYEELGLKTAVSPMVTFKSQLIHGEENTQNFLASLPDELEERARNMLSLKPSWTGEEYLQLVEEKARETESSDYVDLWLGPSGVQWVGEDLIKEMSQLADEINTGMQTHSMESIYEKLYPEREYGLSSMVHFDQLEILGSYLSIAHAVWTTREEMELLAASGTHIAHNPGSNLRLRAGIAPVKQMLETGVNVALGMDGTTLNDDEDMFKSMRLAMRLQGDPRIGEGTLSPRQVLKMATENGARMLGYKNQRGRIEQGFQADFTILDLKRVRDPWISDRAQPLDVIIHQASKQDVEGVIVNGNPVISGGKPVNDDLVDLKQKLADSLEENEAGEPIKRLIHDLMPHLKAWYRQWDIPELKPYIKRNSET